MKQKKKKLSKQNTIPINLSKHEERMNDELGLIVNSPMEFMDKMLLAKDLFVSKKIKCTQDKLFKDMLIISGGCINDIVVYPLAHKIVFSERERRFYLTTSFESMLDLIFGNVSFCKQEERI